MVLEAVVLLLVSISLVVLENGSETDPARNQVPKLC